MTVVYLGIVFKYDAESHNLFIIIRIRVNPKELFRNRIIYYYYFQFAKITILVETQKRNDHISHYLIILSTF